MSNDEINEDSKTKQDEPFEEKRDAKGRRITKKRLESMRKNLVSANKSRIAKKQAKHDIQEYDIESESDESSDSSSSDSDEELLNTVMAKKKKPTKPVEPKGDPRLERLEGIVASLAQNIKKSHKKMKKANKPQKTEKIVLLQPKSGGGQVAEKKNGKSGTDLLVEMLKNNVMF